MSSAGNFKIDVSREPYPVWCRLTHNGNDMPAIVFTHKELCDLQYAVAKAISEAEAALGKENRHELGPVR